MANLADMRTDLRLVVMAKLSDTTLEQIINRAHAKILEARNWSFLFVNTVVNSVAPKSQGLVTVTQGSPVVLGEGCDFGGQDIGSFFWAGGLNVAPYPVSDVQGTNTLSLSNPWCGPTEIRTSYVLAPLYYLVPDALEIYAVRSNQINLDMRTREWVNEQDAARIAQGGSPSWVWCNAPVSPNGSLQIELWPVPADTRAYLIDYKRKAPDLIHDLDLPLCPFALVEARASREACNVMYAATGNQAWKVLAADYNTQYNDEWEKAEAEDRRRVMDRSGVTAPEGEHTWERDAGFIASHDMR